jgi:hypothetical protein
VAAQPGRAARHDQPLSTTRSLSLSLSLSAPLSPLGVPPRAPAYPSRLQRRVIGARLGTTHLGEARRIAGLHRSVGGGGRAAEPLESDGLCNYAGASIRRLEREMLFFARADNGLRFRGMDLAKADSMPGLRAAYTKFISAICDLARLYVHLGTAAKVTQTITKAARGRQRNRAA